MAPTTTSESPVIVPEVPAFMTPTALMPMPPTLRLTHNTGQIHHTRRRWRGINDPRRWCVNHRTRHPYLGIDREMTDARVHRHRRLDHHRMGATHLGQTQAHEAEQRDGSGKCRFERTHDKSPLVTLAFLESRLPASLAR